MNQQVEAVSVEHAAEQRAARILECAWAAGHAVTSAARDLDAVFTVLS